MSIFRGVQRNIFTLGRIAELHIHLLRMFFYSDHLVICVTYTVKKSVFMDKQSLKIQTHLCRKFKVRVKITSAV